MPSLRQKVWKRADACCEYCQLPQGLTVLPHETDHIVAQKHGGRTVFENLCLACAQCNAFKGPNIAGRDPVSGEVTRLFDPRQDEWTEHFHWNGAILAAKTPVGRTTAAVLNFNAPERMQHRQLLIAAGLYPVDSRRD